jgi:hypothetical protein
MKNRYKEFGLLLLISILSICFSWYRNINKTQTYIVQDKVEISNPQTVIRNYNNEYYYYKVNTQTVQKKRTLIPFIYNKKVLSKEPQKIISEKYDC